MSLYSPSIEKLIESFEKLPSIGHKTAARLAFYMLNCSEEETNEFISSIVNAKKNLKYCSKCYNISDTDPCSICGNPKRNEALICVVEDVRDVIAMEKTHEFKGVYHVLHGSISPMNVLPTWLMLFFAGRIPTVMMIATSSRQTLWRVLTD